MNFFKFFKTYLKGRVFVLMLIACARLVKNEPILQEFMDDVTIVMKSKEKSVFDDEEV